MSRVLVTGAGGFIGSHLVERCVELGHDVTAFLHYNSMGRRGWLEHSPALATSKVTFFAGDVRDFDSVFNAAKGCDSVFHLAALVGIPYSYESPLAYIRTNVEGTYNVLQAARVLKINNVVITSTSETYGSAQYVPIDEKHPLVGQSPYSASKIGADQMAISYHRSFGLGVKVARPFNTYGPRQSARAIIPTIISQILAGKTDIKLGSLRPTRDLTFVKDTVEGFLEIHRSNDARGEVVNIGNNEEISIGELAKLIGDLMNVSLRISSDEKRIRPALSEVERLKCDNSKILEMSAWKPKFTLEAGLLNTIQWLTSHLHLYEPEKYSV